MANKVRTTTRRLHAFGESRTIWQWAHSPHCFLSHQGFAYRIEHFPRELEAADVEAALCFTPRLWAHYRQHGTVPQAMLDEFV